MIFHYTDHPHLRAEERLLMVLDELGMADRNHIGAVLQWTDNSVRTIIHRLRSKGISAEDRDRLEQLKKEIQEKWGQKKEAPATIRQEYQTLNRSIQETRDEWIRIIRPTREAKRNLYTLGVKGIQYCRQIILEQQGTIKEKQDSHWGHYVGLNDILLRLIQSVGREHLQWYGSYEATSYLFRSLDYLEEKYDRKKVIRPDALAVIDGNRAWIEFDNDTERTPQIEKKLREYVETLTLIQDPNPVVWVAPSHERATKLQEIWEYIREEFDVIPKMYFFEAGKEIDWLQSMKVSA
jgi:chromosome segregation ATPase